MSNLAEDARREVRELHEYFAAWYRGEREPDSFDRVEAVLSPEFRMVTPAGEEHDRGTVVESVRGNRGTETGAEFEIQIRNLRTLRTMGEYCQVTYEEWQCRESWDARRSTALFHRDDAPNDVVWIDLHETGLDTG